MNMQLRKFLQNSAWRYTHVTIVVIASSNILKQLASMKEQVATAGQQVGIVLEMCVSYTKAAAYKYSIQFHCDCCAGFYSTVSKLSCLS